MSTDSSSGSPADPRRAVVAEWVSIAESDLALAKREFAYQGQRNLNGVGFFLQQAIEKLMKGALIQRGAVPPKTHDLELLDRLLQGLGVPSAGSAADLARLTSAGVQARYPGAPISADDASALLHDAEGVWARLRPLV